VFTPPRKGRVVDVGGVVPLVEVAPPLVVEVVFVLVVTMLDVVFVLVVPTLDVVFVLVAVPGMHCA
jgi:hypothetical protein